MKISSMTIIIMRGWSLVDPSVVLTRTSLSIPRDKSKALDAYEEAMRLVQDTNSNCEGDPLMTALQADLGILLVSCQEYVKAVKHLERAVGSYCSCRDQQRGEWAKIKPRYLYALEAFSDALAGQEQWQRAKEVAQEAYELALDLSLRSRAAALLTSCGHIELRNEQPHDDAIPDRDILTRVIALWDKAADLYLADRHVTKAMVVHIEAAELCMKVGDLFD